ncbi:MAG: roadblock/LC7 domain-containing protein [Thermoplasmata archaeon]|nr:roadblock/LC7 domain-containing protein [Thermoplasmata archaeon]
MSAKVSLDKILADLGKSCNTKASAIVSRDGVIIKSNNSKEIPEETLAALTASMFDGTEMVLSQMMDGPLDKTIAESKKNRIVVMSSGSVALLVVVAHISEVLDDLLTEMDKTSEKIRNVLG